MEPGRDQRPLHVALMLERYAPTRGGLERYAEAWAGWLLRRGHRVSLVTGEVAEPPAAGLEMQPVRLRGHRLLRRAAQLEAAGRALAPDLLIDFGAGLGGDLLWPLYGERRVSRRAALAALPAGERLKRLASRQYRRRQRDLLRLQARQLASGAFVVACSRQVAAALQDRGLTAERLAVVHNAVDPAHFRPADAAGRQAARAALGLPADRPLFLQVAQNFDLKNLAASLEALRRLRRGGHEVHLAVLGHGDRLPWWRSRIAALGLGHAVTLLGELADSRPAYAAADALVHPAWYDACSLAALEGLASGLPAVLSRRDGACELVGDGVQAFPVAPDDPGAVALAMKTLLDPGLRGAMAAQARALAEQLDRERAFLAVEALVRRLASARNR